MKKTVLSAFCALAACAAFAQWQPGQGAANDHARGDNPRDVVFVQRGAGNP